MAVKPITIKMDEIVHLRLKMLAVESGLTIGEAIEELIRAAEKRVERARDEGLIPAKAPVGSFTTIPQDTLFWLKRLLEVDTGESTVQNLKRIVENLQVNDLKAAERIERKVKAKLQKEGLGDDG